MKRVGFKAAATDALFIILLSSAMLAMAGCAVTEPQVLPMSNREVAALNAENVVQVMLRAGFSDEQILQLGTDLRNELARSGAAQINVGHRVEAIFAVNGDYIYVTSRLKGSCLYDLRKNPPAVSAEYVVQVMLRAGFSDEQILQLGTDLRNELARSGAAQISVGDKVEATFAVRGDYVYVTAYKRGSFIYEMKTGRIRSF